MRRHGQHHRTPVLAAGLALGSCFFSPVFLGGTEPGLPSPQHRVDRYSGISVRDAKHAESIMVLRHRNAPMVGEVAPESIPVDAETGMAVSLYDLLGQRPHVLIFGSLSCSNLEMYLDQFPVFLKRFGDSFDFSFVYIREAHPLGGFHPLQEREGVAHDVPGQPDATTLEERRAMALQFRKSTSDRLRVFVDTMDDEMAVRWGAWPNRIFVVGTDRRLLYSGGPGPFYFRFTEDGWHTRPPAHLDQIFQSMPFSRGSLEMFLARYPQPNALR